MTGNRKPILFALFLFSMLGLWQFSHNVRSVDIVGLFASGALTGAAITGFFMTQKTK